jgi:hypothetical protein
MSSSSTVLAQILVYLKAFRKLNFPLLKGQPHQFESGYMWHWVICGISIAEPEPEPEPEIRVKEVLILKFSSKLRYVRNWSRSTKLELNRTKENEKSENEPEPYQNVTVPQHCAARLDRSLL